MNVLMRRVRTKRQDETFLSALEPGSGDAIKTLLRILDCRLPKIIFAWRNFTIMAVPNAVDAVNELLRNNVHPRTAAFGELEGTYFVAVPYNRERLIKNLIRSSKKFREIHKATRLIFDESDLLNTPPEFPKDRAYKDDE